MRLKVTCTSVEETQSLAQAIARRLRGGEIIQLIGDMGAGKTTFAAGLSVGLESEDYVSSPTFTICNTYHGRLVMHHCDFYRLENDSLIEEELQELVADDAVVVLEWAENVKRLPDRPHIDIYIHTLDESSREFELEIPQEYGYIGS